MGRQAHILYTRVHTYTHTHKHAVILAHNNQPQHEHPHTSTHLNDTVTHTARHRRLPQPLSNTHHNTGRTVGKSLASGCCCNRWNCSGSGGSSSSGAGKVKRNRTSCVNAHVCVFLHELAHVFYPGYFKVVLYKSHSMAKYLARIQKDRACIKHDRHSD